MVRHENALGLICVYRWAHIDGRPRVTEHTTSDGEHFRFHYDTAARTTRITDALGREAEIHYNDDRRVVASRDFGGEHYRIDLDAAGNMTGLELPGGGRIALDYDQHSRLVAETDPLGRTTRYQHHYQTLLVTAVAYPDGSTWQARYDDAGTLIAETDAEGHTTDYLNGPDGLPHTIIDAHQRRKHLWWNPLAQVERYQDCSGKQTRYAYDERHHLAAITDALGQTTRLTRKPAGEVLAVEHADGNGHSVRLVRTARGLPQAGKRKQTRPQGVVPDRDGSGGAVERAACPDRAALSER